MARANGCCKKIFFYFTFLRNFTEAVDPSWLGIYWAVSLEFQIFVSVAIIYFLFGNKTVLYTSIFFVLFMSIYRFGGDASWMFRFDCILSGIILWYFTEKIGMDALVKLFQTNIFYRVLTSVVLILLLSSSLKVFSHYQNFSITISLAIAWIMCLLALSKNSYFYIDVRYVSSCIDWLASRSYSLYCSHIVSWFFIRQVCVWLNIKLDLSVSILAIIVMLFFTELSYKYIEKIFIK